MSSRRAGGASGEAPARTLSNASRLMRGKCVARCATTPAAFSSNRGSSTFGITGAGIARIVFENVFTPFLAQYSNANRMSSSVIVRLNVCWRTKSFPDSIDIVIE